MVELVENASVSLDFEAETNATYRIDVVGISHDFDAYMNLYAIDAEFSTHIETNDDGGNDLNARIVRDLEAGQYRLVVEEFTGFAGDCEVSVVIEP